MSCSSVYLVFVAGLWLSSVPAHAQAVISTRAGVVHYFEGAVTVAGQPLEAHLGKFDTVPVGAELRTEKGHAEVLLTPGVFLRVGENSAIRMQANALSDTRVELLAGSAMVDSTEPNAGTSVTLIVKEWSVRQPDKGAYRIDYDPPRLQVTDGAAEASSEGAAPLKVAQGMGLPLQRAAVAEPLGSESHDGLSQWAQGRKEAISSDNAVAANIQDPADLPASGLPQDAFTYYPMLPFPSVTSSAGAYGTTTSYPYPGAAPTSPIYQTGFYAFYLPGYARRPLGSPLPILGLAGGLSSFHFPPRTVVTTPTMPRAPLTRPLPVAHPAPVSRPIGIHVIHR